MDSSLILRNIGRFLLVMLLQILVFNNLYLGGYINLFVYLVFLLMLPTTMGRIPMLLVAFGTGLCIDLFCNVMGLHASAAVVLVMCRILFGNKILTKGEQIEIDTPTIYTVSVSQYTWYLVLLTLIYSFVYFTLEIFSFSDFFKIMLLTLLSTIGTSLVILLYQLIFSDRDHSHGVKRN